jgi:phosphopantetheinyl transferase
VTHAVGAGSADAPAGTDARASAAAIHVFCVAVPPVLAADVETRLLGLLSAAERQKLQTLTHNGVAAARRPQVLATRALCRLALTALHPAVAPRDWHLGHRDSGQPYVCSLPPGAGAMPVFSLSHTHGMVVCAAMQGQALLGGLGVDVEASGRHVNALRLAQRYFAANEIAALQRLSNEPQRRAFLALWTLKEAYLKALGRSIAQLSPQMAFALGPGDEAQYVGPPSPAGHVVAHTYGHLRDFHFGLVITCQRRVPPWAIHWHVGWPDLIAP